MFGCGKGGCPQDEDSSTDLLHITDKKLVELANHVILVDSNNGMDENAANSLLR